MSTQPDDRNYANIGPLQIRRRLRSGILALLLSTALVGLLVYFQVSPWWRLGIVPLCWIGLLGLLQAREKT